MKFQTPLTLLGALLIFATSASAESELKIGWIGPLTGRAAVLGVDAVPAMELAAEEINSHGDKKLKLLIEDDQYETNKTLAAYQRLAHEEHVQVLFVFTYGGLFALAPRAKADGVLLIDTLDCDEKIAALPENVICISKSTENLGQVIARAAIDKGDTPLGMIYYNSDPFMGTVAESALSLFKQKGISVPYAEGYNAGTSDFRTMLLRAHSKGIKSLFFFGYDEMGLAMKQARTSGLIEQFYTLNTVSSPGFQASAQGTEIGSVVGTWRAPRTKAYAEFVERFKAKTGRDISFEVSTVPSYDVVKLIGEGIQKDPGRSSVQQVQAILYGAKHYAGLSGDITVDSDGACRSLKNSVYKLEKTGLEPLNK